MEIYNMTKESINYDTIYNGVYLGNQIFSFKFELFEAKYNNVVSYYLVFSHGEGYSGYGDKLSIKKIELSNFLFNKTDIVNTFTMESKKLNDRVISGFLLDDQEDEKFRLLIVVFLGASSDGQSSEYKYNVYKLSDLSRKCEYCTLYSDSININFRYNGYGFGVFFKLIYLGNRDTAMIYYKTNNDNQDLFFQVLIVKLDGDRIKLESKLYLEIKENLKTDLVLNDFIKLNETRLAFISTKDTNKLFILLIDLYNENNNTQCFTYEYNISPYKIEKELSAHLYNGYLVFSSTVNNNNNNNIFSIFMIFGFGNGSDFIIDLSPHLMDTGNYTEGNDLVTRLLKNMTIDNNIFGYIPIEQIILVSYPPELEFYNKDDQNQQNTSLLNGSIINKTHILFQNKILIKTNQYYYLDYQYMVKEPDFDTFKSFSINTYNNKKVSDNNEYKDFYSPKTFYGRTNRLYFKLCHDYCETCNEIGLSIHYQKCFSCLKEYTYDYLTSIHHFTENCVPYDYLYDEEDNKLKLCNSTLYKFYYNASRNYERYCFKSDLNCPEEYPYLNETTNECLNYIPFIPTTIPNTKEEIEINDNIELTQNMINNLFQQLNIYNMYNRKDILIYGRNISIVAIFLKKKE